ncbi:HotDog domain-containing protein [Mortierella sp. GBAus27b]|nr:HotDog domain-containing protein [Mortierella sp. GBAus27b]
MPIGKIQPSILTVEEPDQEFPSNIKDSPEKLDEIRRSVVLEKELQDLDLVIEYKNKVKEGEWKQADPYWYLTKVTQPHHLLAGALRGENMLSVHPLKFERKDKKAIVLFLHLGRSLCGHDQIIHGGLLGTLLDEATGMVALPNLPFHVAFTANLNINYRKPVKADQFVMITAEFEKAEGRKGYTKATIHDLHGNTLVECTALYISPKNPVAMVANYVKNSLGI